MTTLARRLARVEAAAAAADNELRSHFIWALQDWHAHFAFTGDQSTFCLAEIARLQAEIKTAAAGPVLLFGVTFSEFLARIPEVTT